MSHMDFAEVTFNTSSVFGKGFVPNRKVIVACVRNMLNTGFIKLDGHISNENLNKIRKSQLWSYIYYLWWYNKDKIDLFDKMSNYKQKKTKASSKMFCIQIHEVMKSNNITISSTLMNTFKKENISFCINNIIVQYKNISIPILEKLYKRLLNATNSEFDTLSNRQQVELQTLFEEFKKQPTLQVRFNDVQMKTNEIYNVDMVEKSNSKNADVKVQIGFNLVPKNI